MMNNKKGCVCVMEINILKGFAGGMKMKMCICIMFQVFSDSSVFISFLGKGSSALT